MVMSGLEEAADNFSGRIPVMLAEAGFKVISESGPTNTMFGPVWFYQGLKPKGN